MEPLDLNLDESDIFFFFAEQCCSRFHSLAALHYSTPAVLVNNNETRRLHQAVVDLRGALSEFWQYKIEAYLDNRIEQEHIWVKLCFRKVRSETQTRYLAILSSLQSKQKLLSLSKILF